MNDIVVKSLFIVVSLLNIHTQYVLNKLISKTLNKVREEKRKRGREEGKDVGGGRENGRDRIKREIRIHTHTHIPHKENINMDKHENPGTSFIHTHH